MRGAGCGVRGACISNPAISTRSQLNRRLFQSRFYIVNFIIFLYNQKFYEREALKRLGKFFAETAMSKKNFHNRLTSLQGYSKRGEQEKCRRPKCTDTSVVDGTKRLSVFGEAPNAKLLGPEGYRPATSQGTANPTRGGKSRNERASEPRARQTRPSPRF